MPIDFTCPYCGAHTNVANRYAGLSGPCIECGQMVTVPEIDEPAVKMSPAPIPPLTEERSWGTVLVTTTTKVGLVLFALVLVAALLLPALNSSHAPGRRTQCNNNLKNLSIALLNYHDTYRAFPAGAMHAGTVGESERLGPSWQYAILPFVEQRRVYDQIQRLQLPGAPGNGAFNAQNLNASIEGRPLERLLPDYMLCPSSPLPSTEKRSGPICLSSYVGIAGGCDIDAESPDYDRTATLCKPIPPVSETIYRNVRKGEGHNLHGIITASGMLPPCEQLSFADCTDGSSNTMIIGEQSAWLLGIHRDDSTKYHGDAGWDITGTGPDSPSLTYGGGFISGTAHSFQVPPAVDGRPGFSPAPFDCYNLTTVRYPPNFKRVIGLDSFPGCSEDHGINNPLQSAHPRGVLVAFVDGSVQFFANDIELAVLLRAAIRDDGQQFDRHMR